MDKVSAKYVYLIFDQIGKKDTNRTNRVLLFTYLLSIFKNE